VPHAHKGLQSRPDQQMQQMPRNKLSLSLSLSLSPSLSLSLHPRSQNTGGTLRRCRCAARSCMRSFSQIVVHAPVVARCAHARRRSIAQSRARSRALLNGARGTRGARREVDRETSGQGDIRTGRHQDSRKPSTVKMMRGRVAFSRLVSAWETGRFIPNR